MDIYCGALGLVWIRVYHVTKNTDTHTPTHTNLNQQQLHKRVIQYNSVTTIKSLSTCMLDGYVTQNDQMLYSIYVQFYEPRSIQTHTLLMYVEQVTQDSPV